MLYEDDVVLAVADFLRESGYEVRQALAAASRGIDIVAVKQSGPHWELHIEAKGEGSSKPGTARYGSAFSAGQVFDHVAKAVLVALRVVSKGSLDTRAAIALPRNAHHLREIRLVMPALRAANVAVFWVDASGTVHVDSDWAL